MSKQALLRLEVSAIAAVTVYKFLLRLDYCVHDEQTSAGDTEAGQTSAGAGRLGKGWTTSAGAERLSFLVCEVNAIYRLRHRLLSFCKNDNGERKEHHTH